MKAIITKFLGPTNYRGSRVKATEPDGKSVTLSWDHALNSDQNHRRAAEALCQRMNWKGQLVDGWLKDACVFVFVSRDFKAEAKARD